MSLGLSRVGPWRHGWRAFLALVTCALLAQAQSRTLAVDAPQGVRAMSGVQISLSLPSPRWVIGQPFIVTVQLHNTTEVPVQVPTTLSPSEFEFRLTSAELQVAREISGARLRQGKRRDPAPAPRTLTSLAPGAKADYAENLAEYAQPPFAPSHYEVTVRWTKGTPGSDTSPASSLQIVGPKAVSVVPVSDPANGPAVLWASQEGDGTVQLLEGEGGPEHPAASTSHEWARVAGQGVPDMALAVAALPQDGTRWFGYLEGGQLRAGVAQGATVFFMSEPLALSLPQPRLHRFAWQTSVNNALFLALGTAVDHTSATLAMVAVSADGMNRITPVAFSTEGPVLDWAAQLVMADGAAASLALVLAVQSPAGVRLLGYDVAADGRVLGARELALRAEPLHTMALAPLPPADRETSGVSGAVIDALFGPSGSPPRLNFLRLPLDGRAASSELAVPVPVDPPGQAATAWALAPCHSSAPRMAGRYGHQLIGKVLVPAGKGFVVTPDAKDATQLHLDLMGDDWWAIWVDPALGLRYARLPVAA